MLQIIKTCNSCFQGADSVGVTWSAFYFCSFIILGSYVFLNFILAVMSENVIKERRREAFHALLEAQVKKLVTSDHYKDQILNEETESCAKNKR